MVTKEIAKKKREVVTYPEIHSPNCHTVKSQTCALEEEKRSPAHLVCSCVYVGTVYTAVYVHVGMHVYLHFKNLTNICNVHNAYYELDMV